MSGPVFISYVRQDRPYVEKLGELLSSADIPVWYDHELSVGDRWLEAIRTEIDRCAAFVVVMTPQSEESDWVNREITRAEEKRKPIFPLLLRGDRFFRLSNLQAEDVSGGRLPARSFIARLAALVGTATSSSLTTRSSASLPVRRNVRVVHPIRSSRPPTVEDCSAC
jgi:TIR domain